jgi:fibronectin type 3 domain-containing protein
VTTFTDTNLASATTYFYRVIATNAGGNSSPSSVASATTFPPPPAAPTGVAASALSPTQIGVTWNDVSGATGFVVQRSADGSSGWAGVGTTGQSVTTFTDTNLASGTAYFYRVIATSAGGNSSPSSVASATTPVVPPAAPAGVAAQPVSSSSIQITWSTASGATSYTVQRSTTGLGSWSTVGTTTTTSYVDGGLVANTIYYYQVIANNAGGSSPPSGVASAATYPPPPLAPAGVAAAAVSTSQITVTWNDVAGESGFVVQRSPDGSGSWANVGSTNAGVLTYADTGLAANTTYYYRVIASNAGGNSPPSSVVFASTSALLPTAPGSMKAVSVSASSIAVSWVDTTAGNNANAASGFTVQRSPTGTGSWTTVANVTQLTTSVTNPNLQANTTYFYQVIATNSAGSSPASAVVSAITDPTQCSCTIWAPTTTPKVLASTDANANELGVKFRTEVDGVITGIRFYKGSTNTGTHVGHLWSRTGVLLATATFTNESATGWQQVTFSSPIAVTAGTTYVASYYAPSGHYAQDVGYFATTGTDNAPLHALQSGVDGANGVYRFGSSGFPNLAGYQSSNYWVDVLFTQTAPAAPTGLATGSVTSSQVGLTWNAVTTAIGYKIDRSTDGVTWTLDGSTGAGVTSFTDIALSPSTSYTYRIRAINFGGSSPPSATVTAVTSP